MAHDLSWRGDPERDPLAMLAKPDVRIELAASTPGRFPALGCAVVAWVGDRFLFHLILIGVGDQVKLGAFSPRLLNDELDRPQIYVDSTTVTSLRTIDFDGDGIDEIVIASDVDVHGADQKYLEVYRRTDRDVARALYVDTFFDDSASHEASDHKDTKYTTDVKMSPRGVDGRVDITVTGRVLRGPHAAVHYPLHGQWITGLSRFRLLGDRFTPVRN
jgi:hypothetical protein